MGKWPPDGDGDPLAGGFDIDRDLICTAGAEGRFTSLNRAWERVLGWSREELMGRPFVEFVHPDDVEATATEAAKVDTADHRLVGFENRYRTKEGGWRRLRWSAWSDGAMWFAVAFDVTEQHRERERLRELLQEERVLVYAQPIAPATPGPPEREELLIRLRADGDGGEVITPGEFVPAAERLGLIGRIDRWMVARAVALACAGRAVHVNVSAVSVEDPEVSAELVALIERSPPPPGRLILELTESAAMEHLEAARDFAERLAPTGCEFAIDDWGTGYGSLTYLRLLPFSYLKIDGRFVRGVVESATDRALVEGVVAFSRRFGLRTIGEGVEDERTRALLRECGVDEVQGYLIGRPQPI